MMFTAISIVADYTNIVYYSRYLVLHHKLTPCEYSRPLGTRQIWGKKYPGTRDCFRSFLYGFSIVYLVLVNAIQLKCMGFSIPIID